MTANTRRLLHFILVLPLGFVLLVVSTGATEALRWSDHWQGFSFGATIVGLLWLFTVLPYSLAVFGFYYWRKWRRFLTLWLLAPVLAILAWSVPLWITNPHNVKTIFEHLVAAPMPSSVTNLKVWHAPAFDHDSLMYFEIDPAQFPQLLTTRAYDEEELGDPKPYDSLYIVLYGTNNMHTMGATFAWPSVKDWGPLRMYYSAPADSGWMYWLLTDQARRRCYFHASSF